MRSNNAGRRTARAAVGDTTSPIFHPEGDLDVPSGIVKNGDSLSLRAGNRAQWILEGYIKACFDRIHHEWLMKHIPTDKSVLKQWLTAGYIENQAFMPTEDTRYQLAATLCPRDCQVVW